MTTPSTIRIGAVSTDTGREGESQHTYTHTAVQQQTMSKQVQCPFNISCMLCIPQFSRVPSLLAALLVLYMLRYDLVKVIGRDNSKRAPPPPNFAAPGVEDFYLYFGTPE
jgi:hypothetical protein